MTRTMLDLATAMRTPALVWVDDGTNTGSEYADVRIGPLVVRARVSHFGGRWLASLRRRLLDGEHLPPRALTVSPSGPEVLLRYGDRRRRLAAARQEAEVLLELVFGPASAWRAEVSMPNVPSPPVVPQVGVP